MQNNKINNSNEDNLRYDLHNDLELMKRIESYNRIYNNPNTSSNNNKDINNYINMNENLNQNSAKVHKQNRYTSTDKNKSNENYIYQKEIPVPDTNIDLYEMEMDYFSQITKLKEELQEAKNERKKKEEEAKNIKHRLTLLKNQEKSAFIQFQKVKQQINKILNNRKKNEEKIKQKFMNRKNNKLSFDGSKTSSSFKKNLSSSNLLKKGNKKNVSTMSNTQNNFFIPNYPFFKEDKEKSIDKQKLIDDQDKIMGINVTEIKDTINDENKKNKIRKHLIEKIKQDEVERQRLEKEIAKIEEEENKILNIFQMKRLNKQNNYNENFS